LRSVQCNYARRAKSKDYSHMSLEIYNGTARMVGGWGMRSGLCTSKKSRAWAIAKVRVVRRPPFLAMPVSNSNSAPRLNTLSCDSYSQFSLSPPSLPRNNESMTDAHERITSSPISSVDITPSSKHHNHLRAGPSRRAHISAGAHPGTEALVETTTPIISLMIYRTGARHLSSDAPCYSRPNCLLSPVSQSRHNYSPYSEPTVLIAPCESISTTSRSRSSSAALD